MSGGEYPIASDATVPEEIINNRKTPKVTLGPNPISDEDYKKLSEYAYLDNIPDDINSKVKGLEVITPNLPEGVVLHDKKSGFDATVFRNPETDQIVIAFRGTEGHRLKPENGELGPGVPDIITDIKDVVIGSTLEMDSIVELNRDQFKQADELVKAIQMQYPTADINLTGHSLGGAEATYAAAMNGLYAVTFSAPSSIGLLPDNKREAAEAGLYDEEIVNYIHPCDVIGAGVYEYDRHIGSTYYIGPDYDKINIDNDAFRALRIANCFSGQNFHSLKQYTFDEYGNINNPLLTNAETGEKFGMSPRYSAPIFDTNGMIWDKHREVGAGTGAKDIALNPEELKDAGEKIKQLASRFERETPAAINSIMANLDSSHSNRLGPMVERIRGDLTQFNDWYLGRVSQLGNSIQKAAELFVQTDESMRFSR